MAEFVRKPTGYRRLGIAAATAMLLVSCTAERDASDAPTPKSSVGEVFQPGRPSAAMTPSASPEVIETPNPYASTRALAPFPQLVQTAVEATVHCAIAPAQAATWTEPPTELVTGESGATFARVLQTTQTNLEQGVYVAGACDAPIAKETLYSDLVVAAAEAPESDGTCIVADLAHPERPADRGVDLLCPAVLPKQG